MKPLVKIACGSLIVALFAAFTLNYEGKFSGSWKLNTQKSDLGEFGEMTTEKKITVEEFSDRMVITRTGLNEEGQEKTSKESLSFDGKTTTVDTWDDGKKTASIKKENDKSFVISFSSLYKWQGEDWIEKGTETWQLSDDGKSITINNKSTSKEWDIQTKAVFEK